MDVPAGSFKCIYAKIRNKKSGEVQEAWINPQEIPMMGIIKAAGESQFGPVSQELTSYSRAN
jgi:hypothetical protein